MSERCFLEDEEFFTHIRFCDPDYRSTFNTTDGRFCGDITKIKKTRSAKSVTENNIFYMLLLKNAKSGGLKGLTASQLQFSGFHYCAKRGSCLIIPCKSY